MMIGLPITVKDLQLLPLTSIMDKACERNRSMSAHVHPPVEAHDREAHGVSVMA